MGRSSSSYLANSSSVLACPLSPQAAEAVRRQVRENARIKKYTPSDRSLLAAGFILLITDLSLSLWPLERVFWLYCMRGSTAEKRGHRHHLWIS